MFRPRHAYRSPITNRYRGKAKGCPVFNNLNEISSPMVEQHDECLECLAKLKNRSELYRTLAENNKPSNNVIKSLQRLSSSASNNRLKTCLQFLIIKVNEKSIANPKQATTTINGSASPKSTTIHQTDITKDASVDYVATNDTNIVSSPPPTRTTSTTKISNKRHKLRYHQPKQQHHKLNQLASPPQDQVSSTQDQDGPTQDDHDCQTSPLMLIDSHTDELTHEQLIDGSTSHNVITSNIKLIDEDGLAAATMTSSAATTTTYDVDHKNLTDYRKQHQCSYMTAQSTQSSPPVSSCNGPSSPMDATSDKRTISLNHIPTATSTSTSTATTSTSPIHMVDYESRDKVNTVTKNIVGNFVEKDSTHNGINFKDQIKTTSLGSNGSTTSNSSGSNKSSSGNSSSNSSSGASTSGSSSSSVSTPTTTNADSDKNIGKFQSHHPQYQPATKRRRVQNSLSSDHETSSLASWSLASYGAGSPPSPISSASSICSTDSIDSDSISSTYCSDSSSSCSSAYSRGSSPTPPTTSSSPQLSSPEFVIELKGPRLKLSEDKIRRIKKRPVLFDEYFLTTEQIYPHHYKYQQMKVKPIAASTASVGCSPDQQSGSSHNSDHSSTSSCSSMSFGNFFGLSTTSMMIHTFQAPPTFINSLKPCNLPKPKAQEPSASSSTVAALQTKVEMLICAICGIKEKPPRISKIYGQNSCLLCTEFFASFLKSPKQYYCAHDGDCLMTFDSRCQACWIKICLQKFDVDEENRKIGEKYSPKLLLSPNVSLITIDTS